MTPNYPAAYIHTTIPATTPEGEETVTVTATCPYCGDDETHEHYIHGVHWRNAHCGQGAYELLAITGDDLIRAALS